MPNSILFCLGSRQKFNNAQEQALMKFAVLAALAAIACAAAVPAAAQNFQKPEDAIKYRRSVMTLQGAHISALGAMVNGRVPFDAQAANRHADVLALVSTLPWHAFTVAGSDKGDTRARPEVWSDAAKFKGVSDKLQAETVKLQAAARTGNLDNIKAAFGATAGTCKACHDDFQKQ
jgi:cytochrome c556